MIRNFLNVIICTSIVLISSAMADGLSFQVKAECTTSTDCSNKAFAIKRPTEAGAFISLELKALEQINYKKQKKGQYADSKDALRTMVALFIDGAAAMPGVFGGWLIQTDQTINVATGALLLAYEVEESRVPDSTGVDWLADYQDILHKIKKSPNYDEMKVLSNDPKKLSDALLSEAKVRVIIKKMSI